MDPNQLEQHVLIASIPPEPAAKIPLRESYARFLACTAAYAELDEKIVYEEHTAKGIVRAKDGIVWPGQTYYTFEITVPRKASVLSLFTMFAILEAYMGETEQQTVAYKMLPGDPEKYIECTKFVRAHQKISEDIKAIRL